MKRIRRRTRPIWKPFDGVMYSMLPNDNRNVIYYRGSKHPILVPGNWGIGYSMSHDPNNKLRWKLDYKIYFNKRKNISKN